MNGDISAAEILLDLHSAIDSADLTERQAGLIALIYGAHMTQQEAGALLDITQPAVAQAVNDAAERIARSYNGEDDAV